MRYKAFIDTNVFIYAFEFPNSNSNKIIELINNGLIEAIISERVVLETIRYFEKYHNKKLAKVFRKYLLESCTAIPSREVAGKMNELRGQIKEKDLEQLAAVKKLGLKFLISYDRDFNKIAEYLTPKKFLKEIGIKAKDSEY